MKLKTKYVKYVQEWDWSEFVSNVYSRPYVLQHQGGCMDRGTVSITVPIESPYDFDNDTIPEEVNGSTMGVSLKSWLERDPSQPVGEEVEQWAIDLFWERNFYPDLEAVADDLYKKGLLEAGEYVINIDW